MMITIDFHTHILPGMDDGASSPEMSCQMLSALEEQGVNTVVLTPHYYSNQEPIEEFLERRQHSYKTLCEVNTSSVKLRLGAEVYYSNYLFNNSDLSPLLIDGTRTMLLELPFSATFDQNMVQKIDRLIGEYDVTPVLAHINRYPSLLRSRDVLRELAYIGCAFQVNLSAFTSFGKRKMLSLAKDGVIGALGTDTHNTTSRAPDYKNGYGVLEKYVSAEDIEYIQGSMRHLLHL